MVEVSVARALRAVWVLCSLWLWMSIGCAQPREPERPRPAARAAETREPDGPLLVAEHRESDAPAAAPGTATTFEGAGLHGRVALSHGRLLASGTRPMHVEVRVRADESPRGPRAPAAFALVVDTSGSMSGPKLAGAKRAATALLDEMGDEDLVTIVRFADDASVVLPLARVRDVRRRAAAAIGRLVATGRTDIVAGLRRAEDELSATPDAVRRIALVTDGRDTSGSPRGAGAELARRAASRGVTVSALGIGLDYDDAYLGAVAAAGHGNYEFLDGEASLARFLSRELRETARTTVEQITVELALPREARVRDVWGATWEPTTRGARLSLGSLFAGDERRVLVSLEVATGAPGQRMSFGAEASWRPVRGRAESVVASPLAVASVLSPEEVDVSRDLSVLASVASVTASMREGEAAAAFERGDTTRALALNQESREALERAATAASAADAARLRAQRKAYEADATTYRSSPAAAAPAARAIGAREHGNFARSAAY